MNIHPGKRLRTPRAAMVIAIVAIAPTMMGTTCRPDNPAHDGGTSASCGDACAGLRDSGCREGFDTDNGATCEEICLASSTDREWPLACWAAASTRAEVLRCGKTLCRPR